MTFTGCQFESEVRVLLEAGQWPHACPPELRSHVETCRSCSDRVLVTGAFRRASAASARAAVLPAPGILWWRAQLRRRNEAVERIARPIFGAQVFALALFAAVVAGFVVVQAHSGAEWWATVGSDWGSGLGSWLAGLGQWQALHMEALLPAVTAKSLENLESLGNLPMLVPGVAMLALLGGVVVFLAAERQ